MLTESIAEHSGRFAHIWFIAQFTADHVDDVICNACSWCRFYLLSNDVNLGGSINGLACCTNLFPTWFCLPMFTTQSYALSFD